MPAISIVISTIQKHGDQKEKAMVKWNNRDDNTDVWGAKQVIAPPYIYLCTIKTECSKYLGILLPTMLK